VKAPSDVRYARTDDGIDIAYTVSGSGDRYVLMVHGFTTHLDLMWDSPWHAAWESQLGQHFKVIHFDKRGTGLSDRSLGIGSIEQRSRDLVAVLDAAGVEKVGLIGISEGAPMALVLAATAPERVDRIVIYGGFARILIADDYPEGLAKEVGRQFVDWLVSAWGTGECIGRAFIESPESVIPTLAHFERNACTPKMVGEIMTANVLVDVRPLLPMVAAPTLVIHNRLDPLVRAAWGRASADLVPGARYLEFDGAFHCTSYVEKALPRIEAACKANGRTAVGPKPKSSIDCGAKHRAAERNGQVSDSARRNGHGPPLRAIASADRDVRSDDASLEQMLSQLEARKVGKMNIQDEASGGKGHFAVEEIFRATVHVRAESTGIEKSLNGFC